MTGGPAPSLLLVRHGRTEANARGLLLGRADPALDALGRRQADAAAAALSSDRFGPVRTIVSSPLRRAVQTAEAIGEQVHAEVVLDERLIELDYGDWEGRPLTDVPAESWARWRADPTVGPPGGESLATLGARVRSACEQLSGELVGPAAVVVVSHVSPIKAAAAWALGVGDEVAWRTQLDNASISRVLVRSAGPALGLFNETAHLAGLSADR